MNGEREKLLDGDIDEGSVTVNDYFKPMEKY